MPNPTPLIIPCPVKINCPGTDSPFANLTMEAPDSEIFIGANFGSSLVPPLGWSWSNPRGFSFCGSNVSQAAADTCARNQAFDDQVDDPPGDPDGGHWRDPDNNPPIIYESEIQQCNSLCPDGAVFTFREPAGAFHNIVLADANAAALSEACRLAEVNKICIGAFATSATVGQPYSSVANILGLGPFTFGVIGGQVPPGLTLANVGTSQSQNAILLSGTPTSAGTYSFTLEVVGAAGRQQRTYTIEVISVLDWSKLHWTTTGDPFYTNHAAFTMNGIALPLGPPPAISAQDVGTQDNLDSIYVPNGDVQMQVQGTFAYSGPAQNCRMAIQIISAPLVFPNHIIRVRVSNQTSFLTPQTDVFGLPTGTTNVDFTVPVTTTALFVDFNFGILAISPGYHFKVTFSTL